MALFYFTLIALIACVEPQKALFQWKVLPFIDPKNYSRHELMYTAAPADVQPHYHGPKSVRVFLTVPKVASGLPYTLVQVVSNSGQMLLRPYPNNEIHDHSKGEHCDAITSATRMEITECNQMWVIDSGVDQAYYKCPPQLLLFDLQTNELIHRYRFNESLYEEGESLFFSLSVNVKDPSNSCSNTMVYVADAIHHDLVVYDYKQDKAWRIKNIFEHSEPDYVKQCEAGERTNLWDVMFGMAADKKNLYFNPLATKTEYAIPLSELNDESNNGKTLYHSQPLGELNGVCAASAIDSKNNLYCVTINPIELIMWNVNTPLDKYHIANFKINTEELKFVSGMKVVKNRVGREDLWMLSKRNEKFSYPNSGEINYRVVALRLADLSPVYLNDDAITFPDN